MNCCISCGVSVPSGQRFCSMCYGDPDYGRDGYYRKWIEDEEEYARQRAVEDRRTIQHEPGTYVPESEDA